MKTTAKRNSATVRGTAGELGICELDALRIRDARPFSHILHYAPLKQRLIDAQYTFQLLPKSANVASAQLLNLTYWGAPAEALVGGDVLTEAAIDADVVCHVGWHHMLRETLAADGDNSSSAASLFLGESVASAYDLYMLGVLMLRAPSCGFVQTQAPAIADCATASGLSKRAFAQQLQTIALDPEAAFAALRTLLFDVTTALYLAKTQAAAFTILQSVREAPYSWLLPRFELSNWVLYARAYAKKATSAAASKLNRELAITERPLELLTSRYLGR
jgi:hypothetical protein